MVLVSALIVILSGVVVIGGIAGAFLCKSNLLRMVLLCLSFVGSLAVLVAIIWMLKESALQGDWRTIEDTIGTWFVSAAAFSLVIGTLAVVICAKGARKQISPDAFLHRSNWARARRFDHEIMQRNGLRR